MSAIDIRDTSVNEIDKIVFAGYCPHFDVATELEKDDEYIRINDECGTWIRLEHKSIDHMILALQKAKELGWGK